MEVNRLKFVDRWKTVLQGQQRNFWEARGLEQQEKVLVISSLVPRQSLLGRYSPLRVHPASDQALSRGVRLFGSEASRDYLKPLSEPA